MSEKGKNKKIERPNFLGGDGIDVAYFSFAGNEKCNEFKKLLNEKKFQVSDTPETYRAINSWSSSGLLLEDKKRNGGWRKFSLVELCWLQIVRELRQVGFDSKKILIVKECLFNQYSKDVDTTLMELYLFQVMSKKDVVVIVFPQGGADITLEENYHSSQKFFSLPMTHLVISLNQAYLNIVETLGKKKKNQSFYPFDGKEEEMVLKMMSEKDLKEINLVIKEGKISRINYKKQKINPEETLSLIREALKDGARKEITIKQENGGIVLFEQVDKT